LSKEGDGAAKLTATAKLAYRRLGKCILLEIIVIVIISVLTR
jgi:hypothetical protein